MKGNNVTDGMSCSVSLIVFSKPKAAYVMNFKTRFETLDDTIWYYQAFIYNLILIFTFNGIIDHSSCVNTGTVISLVSIWRRSLQQLFLLIICFFFTWKTGYTLMVSKFDRLVRISSPGLQSCYVAQLCKVETIWFFFLGWTSSIYL